MKHTATLFSSNGVGNPISARHIDTNDAKHTPAPWTKYLGTFVHSQDNVFIADCWTSDRPADEREANARLIALAPELLAELRKAETMLAAANYAFYVAGTRKALETALDESKTLLRTMRAVIARVKGA